VDHLLFILKKEEIDAALVDRRTRAIIVVGKDLYQEWCNELVSNEGLGQAVYPFPEFDRAYGQHIVRVDPTFRTDEFYIIDAPILAT
jgi:hypothetical protein